MLVAFTALTCPAPNFAQAAHEQAGRAMTTAAYSTAALPAVEYAANRAYEEATGSACAITKA